MNLIFYLLEKYIEREKEGESNLPSASSCPVPITVEAGPSQNKNQEQRTGLNSNFPPGIAWAITTASRVDIGRKLEDGAELGLEPKHQYGTKAPQAAS